MARPFKEFNDEKWEQVRTHPYYAKLRENTLKRAEEDMKNEPPRVKFSMIHEYVTAGNRENFQNVYNNYFSRLQNFFTAYMLTLDEKYIEPLADVMWNICDFESWSIPAHVAENLPIDERRKNLDLCSTIAGLRLSEILYFIGDKLPELVRRRTLREVRYRVIDSYASFEKGRYWWPSSTNNWSAVCIAAVLGTYLYAATDEEIRAQLPRMIDSAECYLRGFEDDGCCVEGYGYWNYGFSFFCVFASLLNEYTDGEINFFTHPKVYKIAKFQEYITLNEKQCISFSDAGMNFRPYSWLSHFLKGVYPDLRIPAISGIESAGVPMRYILWQNPDFSESSLDASSPISYKFEDAQWYIYRCSEYAFACKAGHNAEPHNHNDVGSFILSKCGRITFCDPGGGEYTRQYFSPERYDLMVCSSRGHSVPVVNGYLQTEKGVNHTVTTDDAGHRIVTYEKARILASSDKRYCFAMQQAYPDPTLSALYRDFICDEGGVAMIDTYSFAEKPKSVVERFVSLLPIEQRGKAIYCGDTILTTPQMDNLTVSFGSEVVSRSGGGKDTVYYVDLALKEEALECDFALVFNFH